MLAGVANACRGANHPVSSGMPAELTVAEVVSCNKIFCLDNFWHAEIFYVYSLSFISLPE